MAFEQDNALLLSQAQKLFGARPRLFVEGAVQPTLPIALADVLHRLRR